LRYILSVPTNVLMIISSALGYFYFAGLNTFALLFVRGHFHASQATAELILGLLVVGAIVGTIAGGRISDALVHRGVIEARVLIPAIGYIGGGILFLPGLLSSHLTPAIWFFVAGAALVSAANPALDAARLDIMPPGLWGRAESTRTVIRSAAQALAPLIFGGIADLVAGIVPAQAPVGTHAHGIVSASTARGLQVAFLGLLGTLVAAGIFMLRARATYPRDVATASVSASQ
jgi:MFS family permease